MINRVCCHPGSETDFSGAEEYFASLERRKNLLSDGARHKRRANFESMSKLIRDSSLLLGAPDSSETIRPRSASMEPVKRKTPDSLPDKASDTPQHKREASLMIGHQQTETIFLVL